MVMAAGATDCQTQPDRERRIDPVDYIFNLILLWNDASFGIAAVIAIETGSNPLLQCRLGEQVTRELLNRELVEGHIGIEGIDHPVPPTPHRSGTIVLITTGICIPRGVEPNQAHAFTKMLRIQKSINNSLIGIRGIISQKTLNLFQRWWQSSQIHRDTTNQRRPICCN